MDIFDFALEMEHDAESLYKELASKTEHPGIKNVFSKLAEDERKHAKAIEVLQKKLPYEKNESSIKEVTTIFKEIKMQSQTESLNDSILPELKRALEIEKKGQEYYKEKLGSVETEEGKKLFKLLSRQEAYHYQTVENLIEMVEKPEWWVEHAEFTPKGDDYY